MKTISGPLTTTLQSGAATLCTCVRITRKDGVIKGFTNHDVNLTIGGLEYKPTAGLERIVMNLRSNAEVSNQEFTGAWVVDLPETDLTLGLYDDANVYVFKVNWNDLSEGNIIVFDGQIALVQYTEDGFRADIHSNMKKLGKQFGHTFEAKCRHELFSVNDPTLMGACTLSSGSFTYTSSVTSIGTQNLIFDSVTISQATGWCSNGLLTWTSGNNNGMTSEVKLFTAGADDTIKLFLPTTYVIQVGDTFSITAGCDKTSDTCKNKFNNFVNFGGFPHIKNEVNFK